MIAGWPRIRKVVTADEVAAFLGVDRKTVDEATCPAELAHRRIGKRLLFSRAATATGCAGRAARPTRGLRRAYRKAGLRKIGWHTLRHTFCSHLAMKGAPVPTIQELAGHASRPAQRARPWTCSKAERPGSRRVRLWK
jgi:site-specific recombinase XerD